MGNTKPRAVSVYEVTPLDIEEAIKAVERQFNCVVAVVTERRHSDERVRCLSITASCWRHNNPDADDAIETVSATCPNCLLSTLTGVMLWTICELYDKLEQSHYTVVEPASTAFRRFQAAHWDRAVR